MTRYALLSIFTALYVIIGIFIQDKQLITTPFASAFYGFLYGVAITLMITAKQ